MYHIIIAGGIGSRFWPMSTEHKPKQKTHKQNTNK